MKETTYKAFDKNFKCKGFQYEEGKEYEIKGDVIPCENGFHACKNPSDVLSYYPLIGSEFAEVEQTGTVINHEDKTVSSKIKIKAKINLLGFIKAKVNYLVETVKDSDTTGDEAHSATTGDEAISCGLGFQNRVKSENGWIVVVDWRYDYDKNSYYIHNIYSAKVGKHKIKGETIQSNTLYWFSNGELNSEPCTNNIKS
jgi:hypothetical protein